jgi:hypothetical protein
MAQLRDVFTKIQRLTAGGSHALLGDGGLTTMFMQSISIATGRLWRGQGSDICPICTDLRTRWNSSHLVAVQASEALKTYTGHSPERSALRRAFFESRIESEIARVEFERHECLHQKAS